MQPRRIESADDAQVADYRALKGRVDHAHVIVESRAVVERLVGTRCAVRSVLVTPQRLVDLAEVLEAIGAPVLVAERDVIAAVAGFDVHRGVLACVERPGQPVLGDVLRTARRLVVLEGSNDHENIGAIARSARALGVDALVLDPTCADPFARRSVRVSMGEILRLPVVRCESWPGPLEEIVAAGFAVWALTPHADARNLLGGGTLPDRLALLAGAEGPGLTDAALAGATDRVRIPMHHGVDSINLGHALAIAMAAVSTA